MKVEVLSAFLKSFFSLAAMSMPAVGGAAGSTSTSNLALNKDVVPPALSWIYPLDQSCVSTATTTNFPVSGTCTTSDGDVTLSSAQLSRPVRVPCSGGQLESKPKS
jgi:hypothetical protein